MGVRTSILVLLLCDLILEMSHCTSLGSFSPAVNEEIIVVKVNREYGYTSITKIVECYTNTS